MKLVVRRAANVAMASCLALMALAVFVNVVLRYGFGSGIAASEEISRLLFVWMVFIGATAAYPAGEHMAFTSLLIPLRPSPAPCRRHRARAPAGAHRSGDAGLGRVAAGQCEPPGQHSVVLGYPAALLPLPAFLCGAGIAVMALLELIRREPLDLGHGVEVE